jgi:hypothetical protein
LEELDEDDIMFADGGAFAPPEKEKKQTQKERKKVPHPAPVRAARRQQGSSAQLPSTAAAQQRHDSRTHTHGGCARATPGFVGRKAAPFTPRGMCAWTGCGEEQGCGVTQVT